MDDIEEKAAELEEIKNMAIVRKERAQKVKQDKEDRAKIRLEKKELARLGRLEASQEASRVAQLVLSII